MPNPRGSVLFSGRRATRRIDDGVAANFSVWVRCDSRLRVKSDVIKCDSMPHWTGLALAFLSGHFFARHFSAVFKGSKSLAEKWWAEK